MLDFFLVKNHPIRYGIKEWSKFDYIKRRYEYEITKIVNYYNNRERATNNSFILSRLVDILAPNIERDPVTFFKYVDYDAPYIARQFKFVSNISTGQVHENIFYKNNSYVIFNHVTSDFNMFDLSNTWLQQTPIRVIYNNSSELDFYTMDKTKSYTGINVMIVEVDINLMLMMYYYWCKDRISKEQSTDANVFVRTIVLISMIKSNTDIILFNRFKDIYYENPLPMNKYDHPFHVLDYSSGIDNIYKDLINFIIKGNYPIEQVLVTIPTIINQNMLQALYINRPIYTRQSEWSIWVSRISYITFLIDLIGERGISRNKHLLYRLPSKIKELERRSTEVLNKLPDEWQNEFLRHIELIKTKIGKR